MKVAPTKAKWTAKFCAVKLLVKNVRKYQRKQIYRGYRQKWRILKYRFRLKGVSQMGRPFIMLKNEQNTFRLTAEKSATK